MDFVTGDEVTLNDVEVDDFETVKPLLDEILLKSST